MITIEDHFQTDGDLEELIHDAQHQLGLLTVAERLDLDTTWEMEGNTRYLEISCPLGRLEAFLEAATQDEKIVLGGFTLTPETADELRAIRASRWAAELEIDDGLVEVA